MTAERGQTIEAWVPEDSPLQDRGAGILLHVSSLPGPWGIGEIGPHARRWLRVLATMGIGHWQMLPLGPTGYGDSPYQSLSSFAANPLLISLDDLLRAGWLRPEDLADFPRTDPRRVDFGMLIPARRTVLYRAADRFAAAPPARRRGYAAFLQRHKDWLPDFALFMALKEAHGGRAWTDWPDPLAQRDPTALREAQADLAPEIERAQILQFFFDRQWTVLRRLASELGIRLIGDLPLYVAHDSADVWARKDLFHLDARGRPTVVAGVPPDYFSATGQRWGNPLYRWDAHAAEGYAWWISRARRTLEFTDLLRLDHFRGLQDYWEIPADSPTAERGRWVNGPRDNLLTALKRAFGGLPIIAEDLGIITDEVRALRDRFHLPGMEVLQFLLPELAHQPDRLEKIAANCVVYTGTHDNDTARGWFESWLHRSEDTPERRTILQRLGEHPRRAVFRLLELAWHSHARLAIAPLQDVLGFDSRARMNTPGRPDGNWQWRFEWSELRSRDRRRLRQCVEASHRARRSVAPRAERGTREL